MSNEKQIKLVKILETHTPSVHWGWYLFWLIVAAPVILFVILYEFNSRSKNETYTVGVLYLDGTKVKLENITKKELSDLEFGINVEKDEW